MESLTALISFGVALLGVVGIVAGLIGATNWRSAATLIHTSVAAGIVGWPKWIQRDEWGYSEVAVRLYSVSLAFISCVLVAAAFPKSAAGPANYIAVAAVAGFVGAWIVSMLNSFWFGWRSVRRWRFIAAVSITVYLVEFVLLGLSLSVAVQRSS